MAGEGREGGDGWRGEGRGGGEGKGYSAVYVSSDLSLETGGQLRLLVPFIPRSGGEHAYSGCP